LSGGPVVSGKACEYAKKSWAQERQIRYVLMRSPNKRARGQRMVVAILTQPARSAVQRVWRHTASIMCVSTPQSVLSIEACIARRGAGGSNKHAHGLDNLLGIEEDKKSLKQNFVSKVL
jgi:hypothetical protein